MWARLPRQPGPCRNAAHRQHRNGHPGKPQPARPAHPDHRKEENTSRGQARHGKGIARRVQRAAIARQQQAQGHKGHDSNQNPYELSEIHVSTDPIAGRTICNCRKFPGPHAHNLTRPREVGCGSAR
jgi:hypothetical protein